VTLLRPPAPSFSRLMITTGSPDARGFPSDVLAILGRVMMISAVTRSIMLEISPFAAFRAMITFSSDPVAINVFWTPYAIISTAANTNTTRATPRTVMPVVNFLVPRLRTIYLIGIFIHPSLVSVWSAYPICRRPSTILVPSARWIGNKEARSPTRIADDAARTTVMGSMLKTGKKPLGTTAAKPATKG
jgi:hypothetical protein